MEGKEGKRFSKEEALEIIAGLDFEKLGGILPAVSIDEGGRMLMLAFMNPEALRRTLESGRMHYWSRSRRKLWMKGEESGHYQHVLGVYADCDNDSLLFRVRQVGPACHTGQVSCFNRAIWPYSGGPEVLAELESVIDNRIRKPREGSYTSKVVAKGMKEAAKKVSEEAAEVSLASIAEDRGRTVSEAADLMFHLLILMRMKGSSIEEVYSELATRRK